MSDESQQQQHITVIDGGFSTQLSFHVGENIDGDPLWSARFNAVNPEAVIQSHLDFLNAGAEIILTNTYQASIEGYQTYLDLDYHGSYELIKSTVKLAHIARDKFLSSHINHVKKPLIFASIGPYGAHLHDGSEYTGSYEKRVSPAAIKKWHKVRIDACVESGVDGLAIETIPCLMEANALVDLVLTEYPNLKFWISFQCKNGEVIANGQRFSDCILSIWNQVEAAKRPENLVAVGINCINPSFVSPLFSEIEKNLCNFNVPLVVYPNSGEVYTVEEGWHGKNDCIPLENYIEEWVKLGAKYIGGCCRTNAHDIEKIKNKIEALKN
ncbi:hypothetical protein PVAND_002570 [Polypedilum vanderplanki]|uniref:Hcy-binding domain-containing protein n=1 Tax=Polypedilum vanderplanki TaxID=319348 RepID=A0A9J6BRS6_POLVA|nr:hypothetical protein PVAND_002570 [Polypedilum vanderplanki]